MVKSKSKKKVGLSNYIIIAIIFIAVIGITFFIRNIYLISKENKLNEMILTDALTNKINSDEIDNYLLENPDSIIYVSINKDENSKNIEETVKDYININNLNNDIIYLNVNENEKDKFIKNINNKYMDKNKIKSLPVVLSFVNGKVDKYIENEKIEDDFNNFIKGTRSY